MVAVALLFGGQADIPKHIAVCPECGGELTARSMQWDADTGKPDAVALEIGCIDYLSQVHQAHRWHQSEWQPTVDKVRKWAGAQ